MGKLALVLAGGGSLGSYEVGAIEALEELGYKFDIVTGTSIGALNGAFVCNKQTKALRKLWEDITPEKVMVNGINISKREYNDSSKIDFLKDFSRWSTTYLKGRKAGADITPFKEYVKNAIDVDACYNSDVAFSVVTVKFPSMKRVDVDMKSLPKEDFLPFLHASSACFPIFPIEKIHKQRFVDGFYRENLPIRLAFNMGAEKVIAIDMRLFSLEPQHKFYLSCPNVEYIAPYIKLGSLMDFSQDVIRNNMKLGYLDVMKHYKKYYGYKYTFEPFEVKGFLSFILREYETDSKHIMKLLTEDVRDKMNETDYFVRTLEIIADKLDIQDYYRVHTIDSFRQLIEQKMIEKMNEERIKVVELKARMANVLTSDKESVLYSFLFSFVREFMSIDVDRLLETSYVGSKKPLLN